MELARRYVLFLGCVVCFTTTGKLLESFLADAEDDVDKIVEKR